MNQKELRKWLTIGVGTVVLTAGLTFLAPTNISKAEKKTEYKPVSIILNGEKLSLTQRSYLENGSTLVPVREFMEYLGATVQWHHKEHSIEVKIDDITVQFFLKDNKAITKSGTETAKVHNGIHVKNQNGLSYVPGRFVMEAIGAHVDWDRENRAMSISTKKEQSDEQTVKKLATDFGKKLQMVSLLAPKEQLEKDLKEHYGPFVSKELLKEWLEDPSKAPGRLTSSPWPDRIEVSSIAKLAPGIFELKGVIIERTNVDDEVAKREITMTIEKLDGSWKITALTLGEYLDNIKYTHQQYGFSFTLPKSWEGYTIVQEQWEGRMVADGNIVEKGPQLLIRHPKWTETQPRQDIPIMIFTPSQWEKIDKEEMSVSAAPVPPTELARSSDYVFALPPRYNFAFLEGYEEVEEILANQPLKLMP